MSLDGRNTLMGMAARVHKNLAFISLANRTRKGLTFTSSRSCFSHFWGSSSFRWRRSRRTSRTYCNPRSASSKRPDGRTGPSRSANHRTCTNSQSGSETRWRIGASFSHAIAVTSMRCRSRSEIENPGPKRMNGKCMSARPSSSALWSCYLSAWRASSLLKALRPCPPKETRL